MREIIVDNFARGGGAPTRFTLGSLFDGIAGFPLAAVRHGINSIWASEIEPFPIQVSQKRFPNMKHLGSVMDINGAKIEPVDIITFGSPCQDLSVAGKRAGLGGERSGLFFEAIRIINEMREATCEIFPRFALWENVSGALSSNGGRDFKTVLEAFTETEIPIPPSGRWAKAGMVRRRRGGPEIAWRCLDAQYWGVPQRRKRIFLVCDFGGQRAGEILFEPESGECNSPPSRKTGQKIATLLASGAGTSRPAGISSEADFLVTQSLEAHVIAESGLIIPVAHSITTRPGERMDPTSEIYVIQDAAMPRANKQTGIGITTGGPCYTLDGHGAHAIAYTLRGEGFDASEDRTGRGTPIVAQEVYYESGPGFWSNRIGCLRAEGENRPSRPAHIVTQDMGDTLTNRWHCSNGSEDGTGRGAPIITVGFQGRSDLSHALRANPSRADKPDSTTYVASSTAVRRLTPLECERLQGLPDGWTDIPGASDTARYKAIGNGLAIPCPDWILERMANVLRGLPVNAGVPEEEGGD